MSASVAHVGMTVTDIEKISGFYIKYFGFVKDYGHFFGEDFFEKHAALFRQRAGVQAAMQMIKSPDGVMFELFQFSNAENKGAAEWQRTGYHHIALRVDDLPAVCERMQNDGVEFYMAPAKRSEDDGRWVYLKDPDGNMVELWD